MKTNESGYVVTLKTMLRDGGLKLMAHRLAVLDVFVREEGELLTM